MDKLGNLVKVIKVAIKQPAVLEALHEQGFTANASSASVNEFVVIAKLICSVANEVCPIINEL